MTSLKGNLYIITAASGAGKTSLVKALVVKNPDLSVSISYTTRKPRRGEKDGEDYFFVNNDDFALMQEQNEFLEYAKVFDYYFHFGDQLVYHQPGLFVPSTKQVQFEINL